MNRPQINVICGLFSAVFFVVPVLYLRTNHLIFTFTIFIVVKNSLVAWPAFSPIASYPEAVSSTICMISTISKHAIMHVCLHVVVFTHRVDWTAVNEPFHKNNHLSYNSIIRRRPNIIFRRPLSCFINCLCYYACSLRVHKID